MPIEAQMAGRVEKPRPGQIIQAEGGFQLPADARVIVDHAQALGLPGPFENPPFGQVAARSAAHRGTRLQQGGQDTLPQRFRFGLFGFRRAGEGR